MYTFSLNTFIKIFLLDTGHRISEIQKRLDSTGGYDFYNSFQRATRAKINGRNATEIDRILDSPSKEAERKHNRNAYDTLQSRFGSVRSLEVVSQKRKLKFKSHGIEISVDPLFQIEKAGIPKIYSTWSTQKPELSQRYGAVACYIMRETYKSTSLANAQFNYFDTTTQKTYSEKQISNNTSLILRSDVRTISELLKEL